MRWTGWAGVAAGLLGLAGCGYGYRFVALDARYAPEARPHASYFCYDCHGYRYFDPYYDYCAARGYRYEWSRHPEAVVVYRERYVGIRESHPDYGRYRYRNGYRATGGYRKPRSYEAERDAKPAPPDRPRNKHREKDGEAPGMKPEGKGDKGRDHRDSGSRSSLRGDES
ncbi:MAG: hypothetical protein HYR74_02050 [Candidatus Eisenbacteria bacterium]|nr:hypothetical protein [Candidatus Eisenbacteria bacterium]